ncbi:DUF58 domain-containing protein [Halomarina oriensis]|uniref:DUF58 domain-containing protein n=1 Tax=Halomarina oriensis TaxID=671145 RepID=A0A6B0GLK4_9EURY|nr:DUF58 domain-containing protein [Halomarina oriensis]MWG33005.1 DUF58 domain-containing protein [Halomarina oriensis]
MSTTLETDASSEAAESLRDASVDVGDESDVETPADEQVTTSREVTVDTRAVDRWSSGIVLALFAGATGVTLENPVVFLGAVVGLAYACFGYVTRPPPLDLAVERTVSAAAPLPGDRVGVTLAVTNEGDRPIADLRIVDGVPGALPVADGESRACVSLRAGETTVLTYELPARRGEHRFSGPRLVARNASGTVRRAVTATVESSITVDTTLETPTLHGQTLPYPGQTATDDGGEGVEFYSTRQYARGDPMNRIDWKRYARTNELSTVSFREDEATSVTVIVDDREAAQVAREPDGETGAALGRHAAVRIAVGLLDRNDRVGVASLGAGSYVTPSTGREQRARITRFLDDPRGLHDRPGVLTDVCNGEVDRLCGHLDRRSRVVVCTPLADDSLVAMTKTLTARGHAVTVITPDMTPDTTGGDLARIERSKRVDDLRRGGVRLVEWSPDDALAVAMARAERRWSA